ncbi:hypothetical protein [Lentzea sp. NBRC 102530]|uniref:hypothetical protein n=1 Tax=Lentzea sp. NBRC 102530 TaxID=3032201 RepID=UPI0024A1151A|nr:hypothetical protein [Lentzea sp. NBRC 102530]GLY47615.1 hypothetical protein Lesp01_12710 [Lentzea sp. NBRC 102530]
MHRLDDVQARELTLAAVGAVNRRDHQWSVEAARCLAGDERTRVVAIDTCAAVLLRGVPRGALAPSARIPVSLPGEDPQTTAVASDLLSGLASGDDQRVSLVLARLTEEQQFVAVLVLVRAAAAWIDAYMGIDGDTVDAYYAISKAELT